MMNRINFLRKFKINKIYYLYFIILVSIVIRLIHPSIIYYNGELFFIDPDSNYHIHRIQLIVNHYPTIPAFDYYLAYPEGGICIWPPLFDFVISSLAILVGLGHPSLNLINWVAAIFPPLLSSLTLVPFYFMIKMIFSEKTAIISSFILAILPAYYNFGQLGIVDHHVAEQFFLITIYFSIFKGIRDLYSTSDNQPNTTSHWPLLSGILFALSLLNWQGALIYLGPLFLFLFYILFNKKMQRYLQPLLLMQFIRFFFASLTTMLIYFVFFDQQHDLFRLTTIRLSGFHLLILFVSFISTLSLLLLYRVVNRLKITFPPHRYFVFGLIAVFSLIYYFDIDDKLYYTFDEGISFILKNNVWLDRIDEFQPIILGNLNSFNVDLIIAFQQYGFFIVIIPFSLIFYKNWIGRERLNLEKIFFLIGSIFFFFLACLQKRFNNYFSFYYSVIFTEFILVFILKNNLWKNPFPDLKRYIVAIIIFLSLIFPTLTFTASYARFSLVNKLDYFFHSLYWLRENSVSTSNFTIPDKQPEYAVMGDWDQGNYIINVAHRPAIATNFGSHVSKKGLEESCNFYLSGSEEEAVEILKRNGVRYILVYNPIPYIDDWAEIIGRNPDKYQTMSDSLLNETFDENVWNEYHNLFITNLYHYDGISIGEKNNTVEHFRLIFEISPWIPWQSIRSDGLKIYEYVKGASISLSSDPDREFIITLPVTANKHRKFIYKRGLKTNDKGLAKFILPYSNGISTAEISTDSNYIIESKGKGTRLEINEADVLEGKEITIKIE